MGKTLKISSDIYGALYMTSRLHPDSFFIDGLLDLKGISDRCVARLAVAPNDLVSITLEYLEGNNPGYPQAPPAISDEDWVIYRSYLVSLCLAITLGGLAALKSTLSGEQSTLARTHTAIDMKRKIASLIDCFDAHTRGGL
jgi:hypothetical protein